MSAVFVILINMNKNTKWIKITKKVNSLKDALGMPIDSKIKQVVIGLNANGITTTSSCGGHKNRGVLFPWVMCSPVNGKPKYRFNHEKIIWEKIIKKYNIVSKNIFWPKNKEAETEYYKLCLAAGETKKYKNWYKKLDLFIEEMRKILKEFYSNRDSEIKIVVDDKIFENALFSIPEEKLEMKLRKKLNNKHLLNLLVQTRKEMSAFAEFLKKRYFSN